MKYTDDCQGVETDHTRASLGESLGVHVTGDDATTNFHR